ncbi:ATP-binding protein [Dactylosporangium sp. CA-139066]|uniref:ATP-binding protein n=1 Tax=Dactylosporangium sp. CA-139066 TaxID=3239930 RepID=UPI003D937504
MFEPTVTLHGDVERGTVEVAVAGPWTARVRIDIAAAVRKGLAEQPRALLLDLTAVVDPDPALLGAVLLAERRSGAAVPPVPILVAAADRVREQLETSGVALRLPVYGSPAAARADLERRSPPLGRVSLRLQPCILSPSEARSFVGDTVLAWDLAPLLRPARLIVSELATNAFEHAGTPFTVTASRRGTLLHLAVEDGDPALPAIVEAHSRSSAPLEIRGSGLRIVDGTATAWGATATAGGKVVWATLRTERQGSR